MLAPAGEDGAVIVPVVTLVLDAAQLLAQRRGLGLVGGQGQGEDDLGRDNAVWSHLVRVRVSGSVVHLVRVEMAVRHREEGALR